MKMTNHRIPITLRLWATLAVLAALVAPLVASAQDQKDDFNPIQTGVVSLNIAPDARGSSMGDLGAATEPDANSQFWNPSKYAFAYSRGGVSLSYTPWLRKLVNDIFLANVSGYWKFGQEDNQAVSATLRYFSLGEVQTGDSEMGQNVGTINPYEMAIDVGYSRKLSEKFSMGVVFRYIYSDLAFSDSESDTRSGASAFSADLSGYYVTYPMVGRNECQWAWGWDISNIGTKLTYNDGQNTAFLPTNLRIGTSFTFPLADYNNLSINLDLNKLLVPAMPRRKDYTEGIEGEETYLKAYEDWKNMSSITGIFKSFTDAPGGFKEELREIMYSIGAEYSYNDQFFLRGGYFYQDATKGNLQYFAVGAGFALNVLRLDASYMLSTAQSSPLDQTLRFTLTFDMDGIKGLFGKK